MLRFFCLYVSVFLSVSAISVSGFADKIVIISPHRKSIQNEFIPRFEEHHKKTYGKEVQVEWIDQGGTENDLRYILSRYVSSPSSANVDVFWGGGDMTFVDLDERGLLETYKPSKNSQIPNTVAGISLKSSKNTWVGSAMSSFGIFYNKRLLKRLKLPEPTTWEDLGKAIYFDQIIVADPRRSSTALFMNLIMLEALGWEKGWELLFKLAGNTRLFAHSSSGPIKSVVSGDAAIATAIDFYANAKILDLGKKNLGFSLPPEKTVFNSDPIGILKGAPNRKIAERFLDFVLSPEGQRLLIIKKGGVGGPKFSTLGRMAVNPLAYKDPKAGELYSANPFNLKPTSLQISPKELSVKKKVLSDLIGAIHIDLHDELTDAWKRIKTKKNMNEQLSKLAAPPITEKELLKLAAKWNDHVFRIFVG